MKLPKLNKATTSGGLRPAINYVFINFNDVVCTNGHILVKHSRELLKVVDGLPDICYIHGTQWEEFTKEFVSAKYVESENIIILEDAKKKKRIVDVETEEDFENKYPNYNAVIPKPERFEPVTEIGFSPALLLDLAQAASTSKTLACKMTFSGVNRGIAVDFYEGRDKVEGVTGLIMPHACDL